MINPVYKFWNGWDALLCGYTIFAAFQLQATSPLPQKSPLDPSENRKNCFRATSPIIQARFWHSNSWTDPVAQKQTAWLLPTARAPKKLCFKRIRMWRKARHDLVHGFQGVGYRVPSDMKSLASTSACDAI